jgi:hypothetical protein
VYADQDEHNRAAEARDENKSQGKRPDGQLRAVFRSADTGWIGMILFSVVRLTGFYSLHVMLVFSQQQPITSSLQPH